MLPASVVLKRPGSRFAVRGKVVGHAKGYADAMFVTVEFLKFDLETQQKPTRQKTSLRRRAQRVRLLVE